MSDAIDSELSQRLGRVRVWRDDLGRIHRDGGPAVEADNGRKAWYHRGELVRVCSWTVPVKIVDRGLEEVDRWGVPG